MGWPSIGQALPAIDTTALALERDFLNDPQHPQWIDATPMFHDMGIEAAKKFEKIVGTKKRDGVPVVGLLARSRGHSAVGNVPFAF